ncbi:MAG: hypothetical protein M3Q56_10085 [Bacteroidota bacterium]|nr:hypothetical protein [Bacteroidota bacterium]
MKRSLKFTQALGMTILAVLTMSSCNRGYGCPYDFSVTDSLTLIAGIAAKWMNFIF